MIRRRVRSTVDTDVVGREDVRRNLCVRSDQIRLNLMKDGDVVQEVRMELEREEGVNRQLR